MRGKEKLAKLTAEAGKVDFPRPDTLYERFRDSLKELVEENFGYSAAKNLEYDKYRGVFDFEIGGYCSFLGSTKIGLTFRGTISPDRPLLEEFKRLAKEYDKFREHEKEIASKCCAMMAEEI